MRITTYPNFIEPRDSLAKIPAVHTEALSRERRIKARLRRHLHDEITLVFRLEQKQLASRRVCDKEIDILMS